MLEDHKKLPLSPNTLFTSRLQLHSMPEILVLKSPEDKVHDRIVVTQEELGDTIEELYEKLNRKYTIEVLHNDHPRTERV